MSFQRSLRRTLSYGDADAPFILRSVATRTPPAPAADPVAPLPASPNARALLRGAAPVVPPLRIARILGDALALAQPPPQHQPAPDPAMHHTNITSYIPFKLSLDDNNYSKWRHLFWFVLCKFHVEEHVLEEDEPLHEDPGWRNDDIMIALWIYGTISDELYDIIQSPESTAYPTSGASWRSSSVTTPPVAPSTSPPSSAPPCRATCRWPSTAVVCSNWPTPWPTCTSPSPTAPSPSSSSAVSAGGFTSWPLSFPCSSHFRPSCRLAPVSCWKKSASSSANVSLAPPPSPSAAPPRAAPPPPMPLRLPRRTRARHPSPAIASVAGAAVAVAAALPTPPLAPLAGVATAPNSRGLATLPRGVPLLPRLSSGVPRGCRPTRLVSSGLALPLPTRPIPWRPGSRQLHRRGTSSRR
ncbi:hypothetical protein ZWY2020_037249 [Hordeum vulgare]|nr:hypothetical protein ZWY2020_037249 [Hordeum vulgare]